MDFSPYYGRYGYDNHHYDGGRYRYNSSHYGGGLYGYDSLHNDPFDPFFPVNITTFHEFPAPTTPPPYFIPQPAAAAPPPPPPREISTFSRTKIEYKETPEAHHYRVELPGLRQEDVKVHVGDGKVLHIRGQRSSLEEKNESRDNYHRFETRHGEFASRFTLPANAKPERMRSQMENNGVLSVIVPKEKYRFY